MKQTYSNAILLGIAIGLAVVFAAPFANAASSFTYGVFEQLVNGTNLQPVSTSYSYISQLQSPSIAAASSTPGGSLSGGPLYFEVAAVSITGTSSPSNEIATTTIPNYQTVISWPPIPGASGYAVYIGTSTPGSEQSYFVATSTAGVPNTQYTLTSTSSPIYYAVPGQGAGFYTSEGSATSSIVTSGLLRVISSATTTCSASLNGAMFYNSANSHLWICIGTTWNKVI